MQEALIVTGLDYAPSERTVDILPQMLGNADLSPCSFSPDTPLPLRHPPIFQEISTTTIANNNNNPTTENPSKAKSMASSSSSSTSSSDSTNILRTEISSLKNEVKTMDSLLVNWFEKWNYLRRKSTSKIQQQQTTRTPETTMKINHHLHTEITTITIRADTDQIINTTHTTSAENHITRNTNIFKWY